VCPVFPYKHPRLYIASAVCLCVRNVHDTHSKGDVTKLCALRFMKKE
jgi:hypothetical protein